MKPRPAAIVRRPRAQADLIEAVLWLRENTSVRVAEDFVDEVEQALGLLSRHPLAGSGYAGLRLGIPGLRSFRVKGTPYVLFSLAEDRRIDLVRVLHGRRDIDAELVGGWQA